MATLAGSSQKEAQKKILVVDDEVKTCNLLSRILSAHGYRVETASDGENALRMSVEFIPDCVLLDIRLPQGGMELFSQIKEQLPKANIIMISSILTGSSLQDYLAAGAYACLEKPVDLNYLRGKIEEALT